MEPRCSSSSSLGPSSNSPSSNRLLNSNKPLLSNRKTLPTCSSLSLSSLHNSSSNSSPSFSSKCCNSKCSLSLFQLKTATLPNSTNNSNNQFLNPTSRLRRMALRSRLKPNRLPKISCKPRPSSLKALSSRRRILLCRVEVCSEQLRLSSSKQPPLLSSSSSCPSRRTKLPSPTGSIHRSNLYKTKRSRSHQRLCPSSRMHNSLRFSLFPILKCSQFRKRNRLPFREMQSLPPKSSCRNSKSFRSRTKPRATLFIKHCLARSQKILKRRRKNPLVPRLAKIKISSEKSNRKSRAKLSLSVRMASSLLTTVTSSRSALATVPTATCSRP
mmetsp:Transcript_38556/g.58696  ORF Transcript_38556/g.58696 Transcript_38556/m.58696 type:complete len:328 (-) Transcript_38556:1276-2259(-)